VNAGMREWEIEEDFSIYFPPVLEYLIVYISIHINNHQSQNVLELRFFCRYYGFYTYRVCHHV
jgi:hypothetical protein